ncbi:MAG: alpha/beta hydrolase [Fuerstiella sp.]|mgnify:FL=1
MHQFRQIIFVFAVIFAASLPGSHVHAQVGKERPKPGSIVLKNGLVLSGLCSTANSIDPPLMSKNQGLELRIVDQQFRNYAVSTRKSEPVSIDNRAIPNQEFPIRQRRVSRRPLNYTIGLHRQTPYDADGKSSIELLLASEQTMEIEVGITSINSVYCTVDGLTHDWQFAISTSQLADGVLYAGKDQPSLLAKAKDFDNGDTRLNMIKMLIEAEKYTAAQLLIRDTAEEFPELEARCVGLTDSWNDVVGQHVLNELTVYRETGKFEAARRYARLWPEDKLAPAIRVRAKSFVQEMDDEVLRINNIKQTLNDLIAKIDDEQVRREAMQLVIEIQRELSTHTLNRFAPFELFSVDDALSPEAKIAIATSGWLLGPDNSFDSFPEAAGLLQIRYAVSDFLQTRDDNEKERNHLLDTIRTLEGFSIERLALLIRQQPPTNPVSVSTASSGLQQFSLDETDRSAACIGQLPDEYSDTRRYPMIVAFSRGGADSEATLEWWSQQANRNGYVLVVPELYSATDGNYDATAEQHIKFVNLLRHLKSSISIDDDRIFLAGHDIGAEAAMDMGTAHPDLIAGIISIGGLGRKHIQWTAHNSTSVPWYVVVGTKQPFYYSRMELLLRKLLQRSIDSREYCDALLVRYPERGFESYPEEQQNIYRWMALQKRTAFPADIDATLIRSTDTDWSWITLDGVPSRFCSMDDANTPDSRPVAQTKVSGTIGRNLIRITSLPESGFIRISPEMPELDLESPFTVRIGSGSEKYEFEPSVRDLLDDFRVYRDRMRLCYMRIPISR